MAREAQLVLDLPVDPGCTLDAFLPAASNRAALDAVLAWPNWPSPALILDGPAGCGKTHLARIWAARTDAVLLAAAQVWDLADPLARLAGTRCCAIDDADLVGDEAMLLHIYNLVAERRGGLLLTARRPLAAWNLSLPDLRSRLRAAWTVAIGPPDDRLLASVLIKQFSDRQVRVEPDVVELLVARMERSFAAAAALVRRLDQLSLSLRRPITTALARAVLRDLELQTTAEEVAH